MPDKRMKNIVYGLIAILLLTWSSSLLSNFAPAGFEFVSYILMFLFFIVGVVLIYVTFKSKVAGKLRKLLLLTGFASVLLIISIVIGMFEFKGYFAFYEILKEALSTQLDLFVITVSFFVGLFWIGAIRCLVLFQKNGKQDSSIKKINAVPFIKFQTVIFAIPGLLAGIYYSFGGLIIDILVSAGWITSSETPGLSYGTIMAFGALMVMPTITAAVGFIVGLGEVFLYILYSRWFGGLELNFEK